MEQAILNGHRPNPQLGTEDVPQKKMCDKDFAERSGEFSGSICFQTLVLLGNDRYPPRIVQKILWCCSCDFLALWVLFGPDTGKNHLALLHKVQDRRSLNVLAALPPRRTHISWNHGDREVVDGRGSNSLRTPQIS